jgi:hypothetical protein
MADVPGLGMEIARLEELRLGATEDCMESDLALRRHESLVSELQTLVHRHPLRERLQGQLMLALYRSGRQAEALATYRAARRQLVDELGLEPGPALRELERAILRHDAALDPSGWALAAAGPALPPGPARRRLAGSRRLPRVIAGAGALAVVAAALVTGAARGHAEIVAGPDAVGAISTAQDRLSAVVRGIGRPGGVAAGGGAVWITDKAWPRLRAATRGPWAATSTAATPLRTS